MNVGSLLDLLGVVGSIGGEISQYNEVMPLGIGRELEVGPEILRMDQQNPAQSANPPDLELRLGPPGMEVENDHSSSRNSEPQAGPFPTKEEIERELCTFLSSFGNREVRKKVFFTISKLDLNVASPEKRAKISQLMQELKTSKFSAYDRIAS